MNNNEIVAFFNTKGGVGKSTLAAMVAPVLCDSKVINVYEIDNHNNVMFSKAKRVNFKTLEVKYINSAIDEIDFSKLTQADTSITNILDIGGGDDTEMVLSAMKRSGLLGLTYVIPINHDVDQITNIFDTISIIKDSDKKAKIYLVLNRVTSMDEESIKRQFINIFGSKKYDIQSCFDDLRKEVDDIKFVPESNLFGIVKNKYKISLLDSFDKSISVVDDIGNLKLAWAEKGKDIFDRNMARYRFAQDIVALVEDLKPLSVIFKGRK